MFLDEDRVEHRMQERGCDRSEAMRELIEEDLFALNFEDDSPAQKLQFLLVDLIETMK